MTRHWCWCPWRGRREGARGHDETQVLVSMEGKVGGCKGARRDTGAGVHGGEGVRVQGGTRRHRRKRWRGSGDGERGQQWVVVGMDVWDSSGVFTHFVLCIDNRAHLHQRVDERQSPLPRCVVKQSPFVLRTHTHTHTRGKVKGERGERLSCPSPHLLLFRGPPPRPNCPARLCPRPRPPS